MASLCCYASTAPLANMLSYAVLVSLDGAVVVTVIQKSIGTSNIVQSDVGMLMPMLRVPNEVT